MVVTCFERYPVPEYRSKIQRDINKKTNEIFTEYKYSRVANKSGGLPKNGPGAAYPSADIQDTLDRVKALKPEGILELGSSLYECLLSLETDKRARARKNRIVAAALGRLVFPEFSTKVVNFFIHWMYTQQLWCKTAFEMCEIYGLALELGVAGLVNDCMNQITRAVLKQANRVENGLPSDFFSLATRESSPEYEGPIEIPADPLKNIIKAMSNYVLQQKCPPLLLRKLVMDAIAWGGNRELLRNIGSKMPKDMVVEVCENLYVRAQHAEAGHPAVPFEERLRMDIQLHEQEHQQLIRQNGIGQNTMQKSNGSIEVEEMY